MEGRNWGSTVLGWFVVRETPAGEAAEVPPASGVPDAPAAQAAVAAAAPPAFVNPPPPAPDGKVDFEAVFDAAGIDAEGRARVGRAGELLGSLPADTPMAVRQQIVEASLRAFGVSIDRIIESGALEIQALEGYIQAGAADTESLLAESARRIEQYENDIRALRQVMQQRVSEQQAVTAACNAKKLDVQRVLEFFGQDAVARVVRESPKLVDPSQAPPAAPKEG